MLEDEYEAEEIEKDIMLMNHDIDGFLASVEATEYDNEGYF